MKRLMTILTVATMAFALVGASYAQDAGPKRGGGQGAGAGERRGGGGMRMQEELMKKITPPLTEKQWAEVKALGKKNAEAREKLRDMDPEARRAAAQKMMKEQRESLAKILSKEQMASFEKLMKEAREKAGDRGPGGAGGRRGGGAGAAGGSGN